MQAGRSKERLNACSRYAETETPTSDHLCGRSISSLASEIAYIEI
jgi:hypothetical protein